MDFSSSPSSDAGPVGGRAEPIEPIFHRLTALTGHANRRLVRVLARRFGLAFSEWRVMAAVGESPGIAANMVCRMTGMDKVRVSRAVSRLTENGTLRRGTDPKDRRRSQLYLTQDGIRVHDEIVPIVDAYQDALLAGLSPDELMTLDRILGKLEQRVGTAELDEPRRAQPPVVNTV
jgi:DNA-binding MarR family transcriptional regulator